jgi:hypothetical protein
MEGLTLEGVSDNFAFGVRQLVWTGGFTAGVVVPTLPR